MNASLAKKLSLTSRLSVKNKKQAVESMDKKFADFSIFKRVPNLELVRLHRLKLFIYIGITLITVNSIIWTGIWLHLGYPLASYLTLVLLPFCYLIYRMMKGDNVKNAFTTMTLGIATWITIIAIVASGPGFTYGGSVHSYFLTLAAVVYFAFIGRPAVEQWGLTALMLLLFLVFEFPPIDFTPFIKLTDEQRNLASYVTWYGSIGTFFIFFIWLAKDIHDVEGRLNLANARMEELLENILPPSIAKKLSADGKTFAEGFINCTVLFADIIDFTKLTKEQPPEELVELLNHVFADFDDVTQQMGVEKIKTIGDSYMVAAGVPTPLHDHAHRIVKVAQKFIEVVKKYPDINIRIGINSGPVTAGIIGKKKFIYDVWGDTVNVASRLEQKAQENRIQVSKSTYELIKSDFNCEFTGRINAKGIGLLEVYEIY